MKLKHFIQYIAHDTISRRTIVEVSLGAAAIGVASAALLLVLTFTNTTHIFIDDCFHSARPVIGILKLSPKSEGLVTLKEKECIEDFCKKNEKLIEKLSWVSFLYKFQLYKNENQELDWEPSIISVPYDSAITNPAYGIHFFHGGGFQDTQDLSFQVLLNTSYLEEFLNFKEEDVKRITERGNVSKLPSHILIHFPPIHAKPYNFEPGTIEIPVTGVFSLKEVYPHLIFNFDVAGAYYYMNLQKWHPSYTLQFKTPDSKHDTKFLIDPEKLKTTTIDKKDILDIPSKQKLFEFGSLKKNEQTPFRSAWIWAKSYKQKGIRSKVKETIEQETDGWNVDIPSDIVSQALNRVTTIVDAYSSTIITVIFLLCSFSTSLFGFGYVHRKKKDIGILKSCGMEGLNVGKIFISQVILVGISGFLLGIILAFIISFPLESQAKDIILNLYPDYTLQQRVLYIQPNVILQAFIGIIIASILGGIAPTWKAARVNPVSDLTTGY